MTATATKTVREYAVENSNATRIFESLGIDYCCGGHKPLAEACAAANVTPEEFLARLEEAESQVSNNATQKHWQKESITALIEHIVSTHHVYVKTEIPRIRELLAKVVSVHGQNHAELLRVQEIFSVLAQELTSHLTKEEQILFPYLVQMDAATSGTTVPAYCFGTVQNPIRMMMFEHDAAGDALRDLREVTADYTTPPDACISYKTLYEAISTFEKDLHQHIHLENNLLFPRALELENAA